ncbi:MAG: hypothetical protein AAF333_16945 [Planctomycetota bacterium]
MQAIATLPAASAPCSVAGPRPVVFRDGRPEPRLILEQVAAQSPLDLRNARFRVTPDAAPQDFVGAQVTAALSRVLIDEQTVWDVLVHGRLTQRTRHDGEASAHQHMVIEDGWATKLQTTPPYTWQAEAAAGLQSSSQGVRRIGDNRNRSPERYDINGRRVHVPQSPGETWTLGQALDTLSAFYGLDLDTAALPPGTCRQPIREPIALNQPLTPQLERLFRTHRLVVRRRFSLVDSVPRESRTVTTAERIRMVPWTQDPRSKGRALFRARRSTTPHTAARPWVALGGKPTVESTFTLLPGWNAALEGEADTQYDRVASIGFSRFANVYRRWVLNEDARLDAESFDLAALFGQPGLLPTPIPLRDCLTQDDAGEPLPPILEISLDGGATWIRYGPPWRLLDDRAGIYLDPVTIDPATLSAAKNRTLRVRVTASLRSPQPAEKLRWRGNPFGPTRPPLRLDVSDRFVFRRVDTQSVHKPGILGGSLVADEVDASRELEAWLIDRLDREASNPAQAGDASTTTLTIPNARPEFRVGDRLRDVDLRSRGLGTRPASIVAVRCDFGESPSTRITFTD